MTTGYVLYSLAPLFIGYLVIRLLFSEGKLFDRTGKQWIFRACNSFTSDWLYLCAVAPAQDVINIYCSIFGLCVSLVTWVPFSHLHGKLPDDIPIIHIWAACRVCNSIHELKSTPGQCLMLLLVIFGMIYDEMYASKSVGITDCTRYCVWQWFFFILGVELSRDLPRKAEPWNLHTVGRNAGVQPQNWRMPQNRFMLHTFLNYLKVKNETEWVRCLR